MDADAEWKMLKAIQQAGHMTRLIWCHLPGCPYQTQGFEGSAREYLDYLVKELLPLIRSEN